MFYHEVSLTAFAGIHFHQYISNSLGQLKTLNGLRFFNDRRSCNHSSLAKQAYAPKKAALPTVVRQN